ncbi:MAG: FtsX-like permease family protein [Clostridiales bacterium]|nr:FtsX-like permease family protein [Clostridiales bacterium]
MYYFFDILQYIMARWKQYKTSICIIIVNLIFGICICNFFVNFSINAEEYLKKHFFSNGKIRQITIHNNGQPFGREEEFMDDKMIIDIRKIVETGIPIAKVGKKAIKDSLNLELTIFDSDNLFFKDDYKVSEWNPDYNWKNGIVITSSFLKLFSDKIMNEKVTFKCQGKKYQLPIVGVIDDVLNENFEEDYKASMYVHVDNLNLKDYEYKSITVQVENYKDVKRVRDKYLNTGFELVSSYDEAERFSNIMNIIKIVLLFIISIFIGFSTIGIMNTLNSLSEIKKRSLTLIRILGFSKKDVYKIEQLENFLLGLIGGLGGVILSMSITNLITKLNVFHFENISINGLFHYNGYTAVFSILLSVFITCLCGIRVMRTNLGSDIVKHMKEL